MGGNLLPQLGYPMNRIGRDAYFELTADLKKLFDPHLKLELTPSYHQKENFGDADFIVQTDPKINIAKKIAELVDTKVICNGETISFAYPVGERRISYFQIDFICVKPEIFDISKTYFSWNDLGNLMGRIYHGGLGLQYGHHGLIYKIRESNFLSDTPDSQCHIVDEVVLSVNPREIFEVAEFNYDEYLKGFQTLDDMYVWVAKNRFFNPEKFSFENMNNVNKTRNKKRVVYNKFITWLDENKHKYNAHIFHADKLKYLPMILDRFPFLQERIDAARIKYFTHLQTREKFNGNMVRDLTGLQGGDLGKFIIKFKNSFSEFDKFVLEANVHEIQQRIGDFYANFSFGNG